MNRKNNEWKKYIKEAKMRLNQSRFQPLDNEVFYLNSQKLTRQDLSRLNSTVAEVVASDDFYPNPLGKMIDKDVYSTLNEESKTKYIFDLSAIYLSLRAKFKK